MLAPARTAGKDTRSSRPSAAQQAQPVAPSLAAPGPGHGRGPGPGPARAARSVHGLGPARSIATGDRGEGAWGRAVR